MPLQFFTRTQTGALVSRLNNDVMGAQRAFTSTLSGVVSNVIQLVLTAAVMFTLSWQITLLSLVLLPVFILPARRVGRRLAEITRESYQLDAKMNATMTERFGVAGALLVKLFGRPERRGASGSPSGPAGCATSACSQAMYGRTFFVAMLLVASLAQALTYGLGGWFAVRGAISAGTVVTLALLLTRLYGPLTALSNVRVDVMSALVSFERVFEVLDLPPAIAEKPDAGAGPAGRRRRSSSATCASATRRAAEVSLASLEDVADARPHGHRPGAARGVVHRRAGPAGRAGRPVRRRQVDHRDAGAPGLRRDRRARSWSAASTCATRRCDSLRDTIGVVTQDAHLFHETIAENLRYARPDATDEEIWAALDRRPDRRPGPRPCPTGSTRWSASAATASPAARSSASRSPGCC